MCMQVRRYEIIGRKRREMNRQKAKSLLAQWKTFLDSLEQELQGYSVHDYDARNYALQGTKVAYENLYIDLRDVLAGEQTLQDVFGQYEESRRNTPTLDHVEGPLRLSLEASRICEDLGMQALRELEGSTVE